MQQIITLKRNGFLFIVLSGVVALASLVFFWYLAAADTTSALLPVSDGAYTAWIPKTGTTHYTMVDESVCNGTTDYNSTNTVGARDSYGVNLSSVPNGATITALDVAPCASRNKSSGGGSSVMHVFYRLNGADSADAGAYALTGTTPVGLATTSFSGLDTDKGAGTTLEVGAELASGNRGARLGRIAVFVTYTALVAPSNLNAVNVSSSRNDLSWSDNSTNEDGFQIERSTNSQFGPWNQIASTTANTTSYSDTSVSADQTYYYRVRAFNTGGNSAYTNADYAITYANAPNAPSNLLASVATTSVNLQWTDNSTNEDGFGIERGTDGMNFSEVASTTLGVNFYTDGPLASGTYYYRTRAFNIIGNSGYSNTATATIP
ncbi:MAG: fibronectin type III domain-containing protein [Patescibacteria group bacterium]|mgnify:CR=1 FL=1